MRDKCRAWFPKAKRMIHFEGIVFDDEYDRMCLNIRESDCTEEYQHLAGKSYIPNEEGETFWFTGAKDKEGVEVYAGDIIRFEGMGLIEYEIGKVVWGNLDTHGAHEPSPLCWNVIGYYKTDTGTNDWDMAIEGDLDGEVVGNIRENPEYNLGD